MPRNARTKTQAFMNEKEIWTFESINVIDHKSKHIIY
jgi:hypothetical protein